MGCKNGSKYLLRRYLDPLGKYQQVGGIPVWHVARQLCAAKVRPSQLARVCDECNYGAHPRVAVLHSTRGKHPPRVLFFKEKLLYVFFLGNDIFMVVVGKHLTFLLIAF